MSNIEAKKKEKKDCAALLSPRCSSRSTEQPQPGTSQAEPTLYASLHTVNTEHCVSSRLSFAGFPALSCSPADSPSHLGPTALPRFNDVDFLLMFSPQLPSFPDHMRCLFFHVFSIFTLIFSGISLIFISFLFLLSIQFIIYSLSYHSPYFILCFTLHNRKRPQYTLVVFFSSLPHSISVPFHPRLLQASDLERPLRCRQATTKQH